MMAPYKRISTTEAAQNRRLEEAKREGFQSGVSASIKVLVENKMAEAAALLSSLRKWLKE